MDVSNLALGFLLKKTKMYLKISDFFPSQRRLRRAFSVRFLELLNTNLKQMYDKKICKKSISYKKMPNLLNIR